MKYFSMAGREGGRCERTCACALFICAKDGIDMGIGILEAAPYGCA